MFEWLKRLFSKGKQVAEKVSDVKEKAEEAVDTFKGIVEDAKEIASMLGCRIEEIKDKVKEIKDVCDSLGDSSIVKKVIENKDAVKELTDLIKACRVDIVNNTERINMSDFNKIKELVKSIFD